MEVVFSEQFRNELKTILGSKGKASSQQRFPTLSIYNGQPLLNDKGKVASRHKYQYKGSPTELVFFNNFLGYVERQETPTQAQRSEI